MRFPADRRDTSTETWFGTGLRAHLERGTAADDEAGAEEAEAAVAEEPHAREVELDARARAVAAAEARMVDRERSLVDRERSLVEREHQLAAAVNRLAARTSVLELLRERAEQQAELIWRAFEQGLLALRPDGRPDLELRLRAARALLAEAYGEGANAAQQADRSRAFADDELARLRDLRARGGH